MAESHGNGLSADLERKRLQVEDALQRLYLRGRAPEVEAAVSHSLFAPAKRLRPILPCMDGATLRRGRPTCHVVHGEANAVGLDGMIAGQAADLVMTGRKADLETLEFIHSRKTGALFVACARVGARAAGARSSEAEAVCAFAKNLGLVFQIIDDVIDASGWSRDTGKDAGQDSHKTTFAGLQGARDLAAELVEASVTCLTGLGPSAARLRELAPNVVERTR